LLDRLPSGNFQIRGLLAARTTRHDQDVEVGEDAGADAPGIHPSDGESFFRCQDVGEDADDLGRLGRIGGVGVDADPMGSAVRPIEELRIIPKRKLLGIIYERDTYP